MDTIILDNKYIVGFLTLVIVLYASMIGPTLPSSFKSVFNNVIFKMAILFMVLILGHTNPTIALVIAIAFVLTMDFLYTNDSKEAFSNLVDLNNMNISDKNINIEQHISSGMNNVINTLPTINSVVNNVTTSPTTDMKVVDFMTMVKAYFVENYNIMTPLPKSYNSDFARFFMLGLYIYNTNTNLDNNNMLAQLNKLYNEKEDITMKNRMEGNNYFNSYPYEIYFKLGLLLWSHMFNPYLISALENYINKNTILHNNKILTTIVSFVATQYSFHKDEYDNGNNYVKDRFNGLFFNFIDCTYVNQFNNAYDMALSNIGGHSNINIDKLKEILNQPNNPYHGQRFSDQVKTIEDLIKKSLENPNK